MATSDDEKRKARDFLINNVLYPKAVADMLGIKSSIVDDAPDAEGFEVTCIGCGKKAKTMDKELVKNGAVCPECLVKIV
jgi:rRNA maturation endonuclease Nob1